MSSTAPQPQPAPDAAQHPEDAQYYRQVLHDLIDMGTDLARRAHQQATREPGPKRPANDPAPDPTLAFDRLARCVRRCIALARQLAEPAPQAPGQAQRRTAARKRVIRDVEDAIQRTAQGADAESLHAELADRLDAPDLDDDLATRPVADIIADICRDLGLATLPGTRPWKRRTPADIESLCARAARPRAPTVPTAATREPPARACPGAALSPIPARTAAPNDAPLAPLGWPRPRPGPANNRPPSRPDLRAEPAPTPNPPPP